MANLRLEWLNAADLKDNPRNWRRHPPAQAQALKELLEDPEVGWAGVLLYNERTQQLIDGHLRKEIIVDGKVPVVIGSWSEEGERRILATLDPLGYLAQRDQDILDSIIQDATFNGDAVNALISSLVQGELGDTTVPGPVTSDPGPQLDKAEELREKWQTDRGQIWAIGQHRLMCGDSTITEDVRLLMNGTKALAMWTDPPYGVEYEGKTQDALRIANDKADKLGSLLAASFACADRVLTNGAPVYVAHPAGELQFVFGHAFQSVGWHFHETLVWCKNSMVLGHSDYHLQHESIHYGWKGNNRYWYGGRDKVSIFNIDRPSRSELHPTMKPPALIAMHLENSSKMGEVIYDPFLGAGAAMVAAEQTGRICYGMEIEPKYVAVALERMAGMGLEPRLI